MSELADVKVKKHVIELGGSKRELKYNFSSWAYLEEKYGDLEKVMSILQEKPLSNIPFILYAGLCYDEDVTEQSVRKMLDDLESVNSIYEIMKVMTEAMTGTLIKGKKGSTPPKPEGQ